MFTVEKIKLFFNDPIFKQINTWVEDSQEEAINKIYAGQKKLRRTKVVMSASLKKEEKN
jgi:hypothetical protein